MKPLKVALVMMLVVVLLTAYAPAVRQASAQSDTGTQSPTETPPVDEAPAASKPGTVLELSAWGYDDSTIAGPYGVAYYSLGLPQNWEVLSGGNLQLVFTYIPSGLLRATSANDQGIADQLTVRLNGQLLETKLLTQEGPQVLEIPLPAIWPAQLDNTNRLEVGLRVYGPCEEGNFGTITISKNTSLNIDYRQTPLPLDLTDYPRPFFQRTFLPNIMEIVIPEKATLSETSAALSVATGMGYLSNHRVMINAINEKDFSDRGSATENTIIIGSLDKSPLIAELMQNSTFPVQVRPRRLSLSTTGPGQVQPGMKLSYTFQVENSEDAAAANLALRSVLPELADQVECQPNCEQAEREVRWPISSLPAGETKTFVLSFNLTGTTSSGLMYVTADLLQDQQPINVTTLQASFAPVADAEPLETTPASAFFFTQDGRAVAETDGILQLVQSPWQDGKALLIITGLNDAAVRKAGISLAAQALFPGKVGPVALIQDVMEPVERQQNLNVEVSLADLGYTDRTVYGIGRKDLLYSINGQPGNEADERTLYFSVQVPANWSITEESGMTLIFSHSPLLNPKKSSISLLFNDQPIGTVALDETNTINGELIARIPPRSVRPGIPNSLSIRVETDIDDVCVDPETTLAWVTISADSTMRLTHTTNPNPNFANLDYWPQPFINDSSLSNLLITLPEQPTQAEFTTAFQVASFLGANTQSSYFVPAMIMGAPADFDYSPYNIIAVGRPTRSPILQTVNDRLPQPFIKYTDSLLQTVDNVVFRLPDGLDLGYVQVIESPWNPQNVVLVVTGTSDLGMQNAVNFIVDFQRFWEMSGNLALLRDGQIYSTDTRNLTAAGAAGYTATIVPEAAEGEVVATVAPNEVPVVAGAQSTAPTTPFAQRYPTIIPIVLAASVVIIIIILALAYMRPRWKKQ